MPKYYQIAVLRLQVWILLPEETGLLQWDFVKTQMWSGLKRELFPTMV